MLLMFRDLYRSTVTLDLWGICRQPVSRCAFSGMFMTTRGCCVHPAGISSASACKHTSAHPACALRGCVEKKRVPVLNSCAAFLRRTCRGRSTGRRRSRVARAELGASPVAQKDRRQGLRLIPAPEIKSTDFDFINIYPLNTGHVVAMVVTVTGSLSDI